MPRSIARPFASLLSLATMAAAQVPTHAVPLSASPLANTQDRVLLAQQGDAVHALAFTGPPNGPGVLTYARSADGGRHWPVRDVALGNIWRIGFDIAAEGDDALVSLHDGATGPRALVSHDRGATWSNPLPVATQPYASYGVTCAHVAGQTLMVGWQASNAEMTWAASSIDGGATWRPPTPLGTGLPAAMWGDSLLTKVATGTTVHLFWRHGFATAHQSSTDGGQTWQAQADLVSSGQFLDAVGFGNTLLVRMNPSLVLRSTDGGHTWNPLAGTGLTRFDDLAMAGTVVLAVGSLASVPYSYLDIDVSVDGGLTWRPSPWRLTTAVSYPDVSAHVVGSELSVRFADAMLAPVANGILRSDDLGTTWRHVPGLADHAFWPGPDRNLATTRRGWSGLGNNGSIKVYVHSGHTPHGLGTNGTGGVIPHLRGDGRPSPGRAFALRVEAARTAAPGAFFVAFGDAVDLPFGTTTLHLLQPIGPFGFTTSPNGAASLAIVVPNSTTFTDVLLTTQAFVLDPAAAGGLAATRAIESRVR